MGWLHDIFQKSPEIAFFLSLAIGYYVGQIKLGRFELGGVGGSLLAAVIISQVGVTVDNGVKAVLFAVFIYAVGYESGPSFFSSLGKKTLREIAMALFLATSALFTVLVCAKFFHLSKGLAAGMAGGALTQSAIIGTASDAISRLGLTADQVKLLQGEVAIGYAVTYVFGSLGAILVCVNLLPKFMGQELKDAARDAERVMSRGQPVYGPGQMPALPDLVSRAFHVKQAVGRTVNDLELVHHDLMTVECIQRGDETLKPSPAFVLQDGDVVVVIGHRANVVGAAPSIGPELSDCEGLNLVMQTRQVVFSRSDMPRTTLAEVRANVDRDLRHGVYIESATRAGQPLPLLPNTEMKRGDVITFYGSPSDTKRAADAAGDELPYSDKTDFIYMSIGIVVGLLIGLLVARVGGIPLTLGSGGGCLLAGLVFGRLRAKRPTYGVMPRAASQLLRDFGLAGFVTVVGLDSGLQAAVTIRQSGMTLLLLGIVVTIVPLVLTMLFGRYVLRYDNAAILAGALCGSRSANPAFGGVLEKTESTVATVPFAITYAMANVLLTLLGPLVVGLV